MKNVALFLCVTTIIGFTAFGLSHGQVKDAGPRIVLEEEEITVSEDGKERTFYTGKHSIQKSAILTEALKSKNQVKVREVLSPKLKFYDAEGNPIRVIDLESEKGRGWIKETRPRYVKGEFDAEMTTVKRPLVSLNGKYAAMNNTTYARAGTGGYAVPFGKVILFDAQGNVLFEKRYPHGRDIAGGNGIAVSNNGTVAVLTSEADEGPHDEILYAYDRSGKELLVYPKQIGEIHPQDILMISANGRYVAVTVGFYLGRDRTVFFDLAEGAFWVAEKNYAVYTLSDNGIVKASYQDEVETGSHVQIEIDLKKRSVMPSGMDE